MISKIDKLYINEEQFNNIERNLEQFFKSSIENI